jgi:hypothetical protein
MEKLKALWRGDLSLGDAFWTWAVMIGLVVNVTTSILFAVLIMNDLPVPALLVGYGCRSPTTFWRWSGSGGRRLAMRGLGCRRSLPAGQA